MLTIHDSITELQQFKIKSLTARAQKKPALERQFNEIMQKKETTFIDKCLSSQSKKS